MSAIHAKKYLERLKEDIEFEGEEETSVNCRGLIRILESFLNALDKGNN